MTPEIAITFVILAVAIFLFLTEIIRADLVALGVLVVVTLANLIQPEQALAGFSNPAVITVWSMFILSAGLARTGVANLIGEQVLRLAGKSDGRMVGVIMSVTSLLSAFMNNIGVAALFLPITMDIAQRTGRAASKLLIPMAYGSLLGGLVLLISTPSNLLVRDALRSANLEPFGMFDFTPGGLIIVVAGVLYMSLLGYRFLPTRSTPMPLSARSNGNNRDVNTFYGLEERLASLVLPHDSRLAGKTLSESRISQALGLNVLSVQRQGTGQLPAEAYLTLQGGDRLNILGRLDHINELTANPVLTIEDDHPPLTLLVSDEIGLVEFEVAEESEFANKTLTQLELRRRYGVNVLAIHHGTMVSRTSLRELTLKAGDKLLLQGDHTALSNFAEQPGFRQVDLSDAAAYNLEENLLAVSIPEGSSLVDLKLQESRLGAAYGLVVLSIGTADGPWQMPHPDSVLAAGDRLVVSGRTLDIDVLKGLSTLEVSTQTGINLIAMGSGPTPIVEVMLSPYSSLSGKTLRELRFREKYGVSVLAVWRGERSYRTNLGEISLSYGDALLCYGPLEKFSLMAQDSDFVVLKQEVQEKPRQNKALLAALIMAGVVASVIFLNAPIAIAAITGVVVMVLTRCLNMDEAYKAIDWRSVFLIAAMLPIGTAMQQTGAATFLANLVIDAVGQYGPVAMLAGLLLLTSLSTQFIPSPVMAVLMSPIAISTAANMGVSPYPFMMGIAYVLAACFLSPVAHPANVLVMSPGGYRFTDYFVQGLPLTIIVLVISIVILPVLFPF